MPYHVFSVLSLLFISLTPAQSAWQQPNNRRNNPVVNSYQSNKAIPSYERYYSKTATGTKYPKPFSATASKASPRKVNPAQNSYQYGQQNQPAFSSSPGYRFINAPSPGNLSLTNQPKGTESSSSVTPLNKPSEKNQEIEQPNNLLNKPVVNSQPSTKPIPSYERYYSKPATGAAYSKPFSETANSASLTKVTPDLNPYQHQNQSPFSTSSHYRFANAPENPSPTYEPEDAETTSSEENNESENDSELPEFNSMTPTDEIMEAIEPLADTSIHIHQLQGHLALLKSKIAGKLPANEKGKNMWESLNLIYEYLSKADNEVHKYLVEAGAPVRH